MVVYIYDMFLSTCLLVCAAELTRTFCVLFGYCHERDVIVFACTVVFEHQ